MVQIGEGSEEERAKTEQSIAELQQKIYMEKLKHNATLCSLLALLVAQNPNISFRLGLILGGSSLPHKLDVENDSRVGGCLVAFLGLRVDRAQIYWPGSTNAIEVAKIYAKENGIQVTLREPLDDEPRDDYFGMIIQGSSSYGQNCRLPGIESAKVKAMYDEAIADIEKIFREYLN